ncbi:SGNH_hydrolase domain containing protein [uncultured Caudovirales phage]|uniref:SGNH_hydrolase domain containing protein n=1 Tax=uncultured Caudovirales phage TaxID=2100421 RepID=A0A6J7WU93_9CAUD|nr:SGNH_hydrolase domain containing protein [uncultured Caudovirales phage]
MFECLILGDSIAVGLAAHRPECEVIAKGGVSSAMFNVIYRHRDTTAKTVIISLGTNDMKAIRTKKELVELRRRVTADRVFWVEPIYSHPVSGQDAVELQRVVAEVAKEFGDYVVAIWSSSDGVHPNVAGYKDLAAKTRL